MAFEKQYKARAERVNFAEFAPTAGYIYIMHTQGAQKPLCYVGQSSVGNTSRLKQHFDNTYTASGKSNDPSTQLIKEWPLKFIDFDCYFCKNGLYYGLPREVYVEFFSKFRKRGGARVDSDKISGQLRNENSVSDINITLDYLQNKSGGTYSVTAGDLLDVAEILWACKMRLLGYKMLNQDMGGQQIVWEYQDLNGQWIPITANVTTIDQFIRIIMSTNLDEIDKNMLLSVKRKVDPLLEKMLDKNLADIFTYAITDTLKNTKHLMSDESKTHLRNTVKNVIVQMFTGNRAKRLKGLSSNVLNALQEFNEQLNSVLTPDEKEFLGFIEITESPQIEQPIIEDFITSLVQDIAGKLTTSFLQTSKVMKKDTDINWNFYIKDSLISVKGKGGSNVEGSLRQSFTASIEQYLKIPSFSPSNSRLGTLLGGSIPEPDYKITDEEKWNWTVERFDIIVRKVLDHSKGLLTLASGGNASDLFTEEIIDNTSYAVLKEKKSKEDTLSTKVRKEYFKWLSPKNYIIKNWHIFFSNLYAIGDHRWNESSDGSFVFLNEMVQIDGFEDAVQVGFFLDNDNLFVKESTSNYMIKNMIY